MRELLNALKPWVVFVLVVAVLYWAQAVLVPFALSILLTFLLAPLVGLLQRGVPLKALSREEGYPGCRRSPPAATGVEVA